MDTCEECGFDYETVSADEVPAIFTKVCAAYTEILLNPKLGEFVRVRPASNMWSALEYACHVRDVLLIQRDRLILALVEEAPSFHRMYRDERSVLLRYSDEIAENVASELKMALNLAAKAFSGLSKDQLARGCVYNFPTDRNRDVEWLARHTVHEVLHHYGDMKTVLNRVVN